MTLPLLYALIVRAIIIVSVTDGLLFYVIPKKHIAVTWQLEFLVIAVTLLPLIINIWFVLWRYGVLWLT